MNQECVQQGFLDDQAQENSAADSKQSAKPSHTGSLCCECGSASQSRLALPLFPHVMELGNMSSTPCGTRPHNLRIRSPKPCPLGQWGLATPSRTEDANSCQCLPMEGLPHNDMDPDSHDSLPEWSKGVDSSSTSASCVGSNPTAVNLDGLPG